MEEENEIKQRNFIKKYAKLVIVAICAVIFWEILENIFQNEIGYFDSMIYSFVSKYITSTTTAILKFITNLGSAFIIISVAICMLIFIKNKKYGIYASMNFIIIAAINQALKYVIQRPRPTEFRIIDESGYSFPSGHSMVSMAFYGLLIYFAYKKIQNKYLKWTVCIGLAILILLIGLSRIYLGVHYASDVIGGFCFSIAYLILFIKLMNKNWNSK